ncbi:hypothetical protein AB0L67_41405 [Streptomyces flaveolus]|uniref:hypothetical protein n=1 Tax=Streptomyces flaveolus TaxID=67297 RepID=UPI00341DBBF9
MEQLEQRWEELIRYLDEFLLQGEKMKEHQARLTQLVHYPRQLGDQGRHTEEGPAYLAGLNDPLTTAAEDTPPISVPVKVQEATEALRKITEDWNRRPEVAPQDALEEKQELIDMKRNLWEEYFRATQRRNLPTAKEFRRLQENARMAQEARQSSCAGRVRKDWTIPDSPTLGPEQSQSVVAAANAAIRYLSSQAPPPGRVSRRSEERGNRQDNDRLQRANAFRRTHR